MNKSVEFYYAKESNNKEDSKIFVFSYVKIGDGGYDYYLISLFLKDNSVEYDISKINNIFAYITEHRIKLSKIDNKLNDNLYNYLIKILWEYIHKNKYTTFNLPHNKPIKITSEDLRIDTNNISFNPKVAPEKTDLKKVK